MENHTRLEKLLALPSDRELDIELAKLAGYTVYHYDKSYPTSNYFMLMTPEFDCALYSDPDNRDFSGRAGERETEAEAWRDAPKFSWSLNATMILVSDCPAKFDLKRDGNYWQARFRLKPKGFVTGESYSSPQQAIIKAWLLWKFSTSETLGIVNHD